MNFVFQSRGALTFALAAILGLGCFTFGASAQQAYGREIIFPTTIQWNKQKGVTRYRLQIAADDKFQNMFVDRPITGERYVVSDLSAGYYYWRVAPADSHAGGYSRPVRFFLSGGVVTTVKQSVLPPDRAPRPGSPAGVVVAGGGGRSRRRF